MRIAQIAPLVERVPPKKYGGTERMIHALTEELVRRGHEVTLFATGDSITSAKLVSSYPRALREARIKDLYGFNIWTVANLGEAYKRHAEFDIIHDHTGHLGLPAAQVVASPVVLTIHDEVDYIKRRVFQALNRPYVVSISKSHAGSMLGMNHLATIYHGLDMKNYPFSEGHDGYLLYVGRICIEKGTHHAIEVAQYLNLPLIIAAKLETTQRLYFQEYVEPFLSNDIQWIGEVDTEERNKLMSRARAFLHPITWNEPFGLTLIEAAACGCPVIAFGRGSIPEIVAHGKTGFVVNDLESMVEAVQASDTIDPKTCRDHALQNFNVEQMTSAYEAVYRKILSN